jgi:hypothetical protein
MHPERYLVDVADRWEPDRPFRAFGRAILRSTGKLFEFLFSITPW